MVIVIMKRHFTFFVSFWLWMALAGCATGIVSVSSPHYAKMENDNYYFSITPLSANERHCGFRLILKNKTANPIFVDWNKTGYIHDNEYKGGFIFDSMNFENRNDPKLIERVRARDIFIKTIWPGILAHGDLEQWTQMPMEPGNHGVEVAIVMNGRTFTERLVVRISNREK